MLSPLLFLLVLDWITKTAYGNTNTGIQWTFSKKLEDLQFADDLALLSHRLQDIQNKLTSLEETAQLVGLKINAEKTKLLQANTKQDPQFTIYGTNIEDVREFTYLGSKVSQSGGTDEDITARIKKARQAFAILKPV